MIRLLFILILHGFFIGGATSQGITVNDLVTLSTLPQKSIDKFMNKRGFLPGGRSLQNKTMALTFFQKKSNKKKDTLAIIRSVAMYKEEGSYFFALQTSSMDEYLDGKKRLKKAGFFYDKKKDTSGAISMLFQNKNVTVRANITTEDTSIQYTFLLQKKEMPDPAAIQYAEDLLNFDSHEYLVSFFGEKNLKKDIYYFSEKELKQCSILFANTSQQAIFVWEDEADFRKLSYVLISGISPALTTGQYNGKVDENRWILKNGIYSGMSLKKLLQLNGGDFEFYGLINEFSYMVAPKNTGSIDFKKIGIMLGCLDCNGSHLMEKARVSAADAVDNNLSLYIFYIMITP